MAVNYRQPSKKASSINRRSWKKPLLITGVSFLIALLLILGYWLIFSDNKASAPQSVADLNTPSSATNPEPTKPVYKPVKLQPTVDKWVNAQAADYNIVVYDAQAKKVTAKTNPDQSLFAASLYKMYVAYLSLLDIQNGKMDPNEVLTGGFTRKQCIDKMIRESYSPCGEAMMADMGQMTLNERVKGMGMTGTTFNGIQTSAHDSALILRYIDQQRDLNKKNTAFLRDAMETQPDMYEKGLKTGAPKAKWETKVGWNLDINYHDIGIMTMPDGRVFYVAILGQGSGSSKPIADFASTIYNALN